MENIKVQYSNRISRTGNAPITITNVAEVSSIKSNYLNNYNGVFNVRNSSIEISSSVFRNNYTLYSSGGVILVSDNNQHRITITNSTFTNNSVTGRSRGGAICIAV